MATNAYYGISMGRASDIWNHLKWMQNKRPQKAITCSNQQVYHNSSNLPTLHHHLLEATTLVSAIGSLLNLLL